MSSLTNPTLMPVTGRELQTILSYHPIGLALFEEATVYDLGCGTSDLGADLALKGITATVKGYDSNLCAVQTELTHEQSTQRIHAELDSLPAADESADIVLATYSLPFWATTELQVHKFYSESARVTKVGGLLSIFPAYVQRDRLDTPYQEMLNMKRSGKWKIFSVIPDLFTAQKVAV